MQAVSSAPFIYNVIKSLTPEWNGWGEWTFWRLNCFWEIRRNCNEDISWKIKLKLLYLTKNRDRKDWVDICAMSRVCVTSRPFASWLILTICLDLDGWQLSAERLGWKTHHSEQTADQTVSSVLSRSAIPSVSLFLSYPPSLLHTWPVSSLWINN